MKKPIRILHIVSSMDIGGIETMLMNYYRRLDRRKVQFDFLEHRSRGYYDSEIESYGGKICQISAPNPFSPHYRLELMRFFNNHSEYQIVHAHMNCMSSLPLYYAKKAGVPVRISHAHNTDTPHNVKYPIKIYWKYKIPNVATDIMPQATLAKPAIKRWLSVKLMLAPATIIPNVRPDLRLRRVAYPVKQKN